MSEMKPSGATSTSPSEDAKRLAEQVLAEMVRLNLEGETGEDGDAIRDYLASILDSMWIGKPGPAECICGKMGEADDAGTPIPPFGMVCFFAPSQDEAGNLGHTKLSRAFCSPACSVRVLSQLLRHLFETVQRMSAAREAAPPAPEKS